MRERGETFHTNRSLRFSPPSGDELPVDTAWFWRGDPATMQVLLAWQHWERAAREQYFNLDEGDIPTELIPDQRVLIEARLDTETARFPTDIKTLRQRLANPTDPLSRTESWVATSVRQQPPLSDEEDLTESVFDEDDEPRPHTYQFTIEQRTGPTPPEPDEAGDDGTPIPIQSTAESEGTSSEDADPAETGQAGTDAPRDGSIDVSGFIDGHEDAVAGSDLTPALEPVVEALDRQGWTHEVDEDGTRISLRATFGDHSWPVVIESGEKADWCRITSIHPVEVRETRRAELATDLLSYNSTIDRGGFDIDADTGRVRFHTPFVPDAASTSDAIGENVTAMAEWYERIAP